MPIVVKPIRVTPLSAAVVATIAALSSYVGFRQLRGHYANMRSHTPVMDRLHQIGLGILLYCTEHKGLYPRSSADLASSEGLAADIAVCPPDPLGRIYETHRSYTYLGRGMTTSTADATTVVAYSPPDSGGLGGPYLLFGDGHLDWIPAADLPAVLARGGPATSPATPTAR